MPIRTPENFAPPPDPNEEEFGWEQAQGFTQGSLEDLRAEYGEFGALPEDVDEVYYATGGDYSAAREVLFRKYDVPKFRRANAAIARATESERYDANFFAPWRQNQEYITKYQWGSMPQGLREQWATARPLSDFEHDDYGKPILPLRLKGREEPAGYVYRQGSFAWSTESIRGTVPWAMEGERQLVTFSEGKSPKRVPLTGRHEQVDFTGLEKAPEFIPAGPGATQADRGRVVNTAVVMGADVLGPGAYVYDPGQFGEMTKPKYVEVRPEEGRELGPFAEVGARAGVGEPLTLAGGRAPIQHRSWGHRVVGTYDVPTEQGMGRGFLLERFQERPFRAKEEQFKAEFVARARMVQGAEYDTGEPLNVGAIVGGKDIQTHIHSFYASRGTEFLRRTLAAHRGVPLEEVGASLGDYQSLGREPMEAFQSQYPELLRTIHVPHMLSAENLELARKARSVVTDKQGRERVREVMPGRFEAYLAMQALVMPQVSRAYAEHTVKKPFLSAEDMEKLKQVDPNAYKLLVSDPYAKEMRRFYVEQAQSVKSTFDRGPLPKDAIEMRKLGITENWEAARRGVQAIARAEGREVEEPHITDVTRQFFEMLAGGEYGQRMMHADLGPELGRVVLPSAETIAKMGAEGEWAGQEVGMATNAIRRFMLAYESGNKGAISEAYWGREIKTPYHQLRKFQSGNVLRQGGEVLRTPEGGERLSGVDVEQKRQMGLIDVISAMGKQGDLARRIGGVHYRGTGAQLEPSTALRTGETYVPGEEPGGIKVHGFPTNIRAMALRLMNISAEKAGLLGIESRGIVMGHALTLANARDYDGDLAYAFSIGRLSTDEHGNVIASDGQVLSSPLEILAAAKFAKEGGAADPYETTAGLGANPTYQEARADLVRKIAEARGMTPGEFEQEYIDRAKLQGAIGPYYNVWRRLGVSVPEHAKELHQKLFGWSHGRAQRPEEQEAGIKTLLTVGVGMKAGKSFAYEPISGEPIRISNTGIGGVLARVAMDLADQGRISPEDLETAFKHSLSGDIAGALEAYRGASPETKSSRTTDLINALGLGSSTKGGMHAAVTESYVGRGLVPAMLAKIDEEDWGESGLEERTLEALRPHIRAQQKYLSAVSKRKPSGIRAGLNRLADVEDVWGREIFTREDVASAQLDEDQLLARSIYKEEHEELAQRVMAGDLDIESYKEILTSWATDVDPTKKKVPGVAERQAKEMWRAGETAEQRDDWLSSTFEEKDFELARAVSRMSEGKIGIQELRQMGYTGSSKGRSTVWPSTIGHTIAQGLVDKWGSGWGSGSGGGGEKSAQSPSSLAGLAVHKVLEAMHGETGEVKFRGKFGGVEVSGRADVWDAVKKLLIDYKTGRADPQKYRHQIRAGAHVVGAERALVKQPEGEAVGTMARLTGKIATGMEAGEIRKTEQGLEDLSPEMQEMAVAIAQNMYESEGTEIDLGPEAMKESMLAAEEQADIQSVLGELKRRKIVPSSWPVQPPLRYSEQVRYAEEKYLANLPTAPGGGSGGRGRPPGKASAAPTAGEPPEESDLRNFLLRGAPPASGAAEERKTAVTSGGGVGSGGGLELAKTEYLTQWLSPSGEVKTFANFWREGMTAPFAEAAARLEELRPYSEELLARGGPYTSKQLATLKDYSGAIGAMKKFSYSRKGMPEDVLAVMREYEHLWGVGEGSFDRRGVIQTTRSREGVREARASEAKGFMGDSEKVFGFAINQMQSFGEGLARLNKLVEEGSDVRKEDIELYRKAKASSKFVREFIAQGGEVGPETMRALSNLDTVEALSAMQGGLSAAGGGGGGLLGGVATRLQRLAVGWTPMQMQRAWRMFGGPTFGQYIPAAAQAETAGWQMTQAMGGYTPGLPEGAAGGVMQARAALSQAQITAGRAGYRAYGGMMGAGAVLPSMLGVAGPAAGAGLATLIGANTALAGSSMAALAGPLALGVTGMVGAFAGGQYIGSFGQETAENQMALINRQGEVGPLQFLRSVWGRTKAQAQEQPTFGIPFASMGMQVLSQGVTTLGQIPEAVDWTIQQAREARESYRTPMSELTGMQRMAALNKAAAQMREQGGTVWSGMDEGQILQTLGGFMPYTQAFQGMTAKEIAGGGVPDWITSAVSMGYQPQQFAQMAQAMGMGIEGTEQVGRIATQEGMGAYEFMKWQSQVGKSSWLKGLGFSQGEILQATGVRRKPEYEAGASTYGGLEYAGPQYTDEQWRYAQTVAGVLESTRGKWQAQGVEMPEIGTQYTPQDLMGMPGGLSLAEAVGQQRAAGVAIGAAGRFGFSAAAMQKLFPQQMGAQQAFGIQAALSGQGNLQQMQMLGAMTGMNITPNLITRGPGGLQMGTIAPVGYGMGMGQFIQQYRGAQSRLNQAMKTGDFIGGWDMDTEWGLQDYMSDLSLEHSRAQAGFQMARLRLQEERLEKEEAGIGPNALARQLNWATALGGESPVTPGYQYTGRFPMMRQQEAMTFGYTMQNYGFQQQMMQMNQAWQQQQFGWQQEQLGVRRDQFATQMGWTREDWSWQRGRNAREFGWQMEDYEEDIRFATGRQRERLLVQQERDVIRYGEERGRAGTMEERQEEMWRWQEEAFDREEKQLAMRKQHAEEIADLQMQQHQAQVQYAQEAHQFRLQQIDEQEQAFKDQWEIQEEQRKEDLEYARKNLEISKAAAGEAAAYAEKMAAAQEDMRNIQRQQAVLVSDWQQAMTRALIEILREISPEEAAILQGYMTNETGISGGRALQ